MDVGTILDLIVGLLGKKFADLKRNERSIIFVSGGDRYQVRVKQKVSKATTVAARAKRAPKKKAAA